MCRSLKVGNNHLETVGESTSQNVVMLGRKLKKKETCFIRKCFSTDNSKNFGINFVIAVKTSFLSQLLESYVKTGTQHIYIFLEISHCLRTQILSYPFKTDSSHRGGWLSGWGGADKRFFFISLFLSLFVIPTLKAQFLLDLGFAKVANVFYCYREIYVRLASLVRRSKKKKEKKTTLFFTSQQLYFEAVLGARIVSD